MITMPVDMPLGARGEMILWVTRYCVCLPTTTPGSLETIHQWCEQHWGEQRAGNILHEAQEGWIDYFDGDWQIAFNPWCAHEELILWVSDKSKLTQFCLTWS